MLKKKFIPKKIWLLIITLIFLLGTLLFLYHPKTKAQEFEVEVYCAPYQKSEDKELIEVPSNSELRIESITEGQDSYFCNAAARVRIYSGNCLNVDCLSSPIRWENFNEPEKEETIQLEAGEYTLEASCAVECVKEGTGETWAHAWGKVTILSAEIPTVTLIDTLDQKFDLDRSEISGPAGISCDKTPDGFKCEIGQMNPGDEYVFEVTTYLSDQAEEGEILDNTATLEAEGMAPITETATIQVTAPLNNPPQIDKLYHFPLDPTQIDQVKISVSASDKDKNDGISSIEIWVDGNKIKTCLLSNDCQSLPKTYSTGQHTYYAKVCDTNGNCIPSEVKSFTVTAALGRLEISPREIKGKRIGDEVEFTATVYDISGVDITDKVEILDWNISGKGRVVSQQGKNRVTVKAIGQGVITVRATAKIGEQTPVSGTATIYVPELKGVKIIPHKK